MMNSKYLTWRNNKNFFSSAVDRLETFAAALGAGLQALGELRNGERRQAITREFIYKKHMRKSGIK